MARRRAPTRRWHIGDQCQIPWYRAEAGHRGEVGGWHPGTVIAIRRDSVVVLAYGWEYTRPRWELREPSPHRGVWRRWWNHDKRSARL